MKGTWQTDGHERGGLVALVVVLVIVAAVIHAIWHTIVEAAEIVAIVFVSAVGAVALAGVAYAALRIRDRVAGQQAGRPVTVRAEVVQLEPERAALEATSPAAWPLPGWWADVRPHVGHDDERR